MRGMSAKDFDPVRYSGRWFEVASLKRGFAGQGQEDCHCTQVNAVDSYDWTWDEDFYPLGLECRKRNLVSDLS